MYCFTKIKKNKNMLYPKMKAVLNQQVNAELWSSYLYLSMSYDMDSKGYEGFASWFASQSKEEFEHATKIMKFIGEMDEKVSLLPIEEVRQEWGSPKEAFEDTLMYEKITTENIHKLMDMAIELKDYASQNMLKWFIDEQIEEENTVRKIIEKLSKVANCPMGLYHLDKQLGKRE